MSSTEGEKSFGQIALAKLKAYLPYGLSAGALLIFVTYLWRNFDRYRQLLNVSFATILSLMGLVLVFALINGAINYFFYRALDVFLTFNESVGLAAINTLANQLPFAGGLVAKGVYLKQRHQLAYTHFLSATMALYVCFVAVNGAVALTVLGGWALVEGIEVPPALVLGFSGMVAGVISLWIPVDALSLPGKLGKRLMQLAEGWRVLSRNLDLVGIMIGFQVLTTLLFAGRFWIAFHALSQDVTYAQCLLFSSATVLTRLVNIAPGGLGVREGIVAGVASLLGFEAGVSAVAVGIDRLVATSVIIVLGTIYTYVLSKKATDSEPADAISAGE
ncbi:MAG: flippase-like domain-containing protein [Anaerolineae bacterium]